VIGDALAYLDRTDEQWDVVISDLSDPVENGPAYQLFTRGYFERARKVMAPGGVFAVQAGPVSPADMTIHVRLVNTVASVWDAALSYQASVPSFGTQWGFILASDKALSRKPDEAAADAALEQHVRGALNYLDGAMLRAQRQTPPFLRAAIEAETRVYTTDDPPKFGE